MGVHGSGLERGVGACAARGGAGLGFWGFSQVCRDPSKVRGTSAAGRPSRQVNTGRTVASRSLQPQKEVTDMGGAGRA